MKLYQNMYHTITDHPMIMVLLKSLDIIIINKYARIRYNNKNEK